MIPVLKEFSGKEIDAVNICSNPAFDIYAFRDRTYSV